MDVSFNDKDIKLVRHLRECLSSKTVDLVSLDNLLTSLEGKLSTSPIEGSKKRRVVKNERVFRHMQNIISPSIKKKIA